MILPPGSSLGRVIDGGGDVRIRSCGAAAAMLFLIVPAGRALAGCTLGRIAQLPVTMFGRQPTVSARIDGTSATFLVDSGAFYSVLLPQTVREYHLHLAPAPYGFEVSGIGGTNAASVANVSVLTLGRANLRNLQFVVASFGASPGLAGVIGQNILRLTDAEYDLANGVFRLWRPTGCRHSMLAYWAKSQPYGVIDIDWTSPGAPFIVGSARLNGTRVRVLFDTGSSNSIVSLHAAEEAGFERPDHSATPATRLYGIGERALKAWVWTFPTFRIGNETVHNARLHVADLRGLDADMILGADFFLAHRIYVSVSQRKLYFTYNGGPVFSISSPPVHSPASPHGGTAPLASSKSPAPAASSGPQPTDAAGFSRRGAAFTSRHEFTLALADLTRACQLDPTNPQYFYQRAMARVGNRQPDLALTDLDQALKLDPQYAQALIGRAALRVARHDETGAAADLAAVDRLVPPEANVRLDLADLYFGAERYGLAIRQYDVWLASHPEDPRRAHALNGRCRTRAVWGRDDLKKALRDCDRALDLEPGNAEILDSRSLVEQRLGRYGRSIRDESAALRTEPRNAWFLYARGVAELRDGRTAAGEADIAAAKALKPNVAAEGRRYGLAP